MKKVLDVYPQQIYVVKKDEPLKFLEILKKQTLKYLLERIQNADIGKNLWQCSKYWCNDHYKDYCDKWFIPSHDIFSIQLWPKLPKDSKYRKYFAKSFLIDLCCVKKIKKK